MLIIGSPYCNASSRFFKWLHDNNDFAKNISQNSSILLNESIFPDINTLNKIESFTLISTMQVHKSNLWPEIKYWGTPSFYYIEKGVIQDRYEGWPHEKGGVKFKEFLKKNKFLNND